MKLKAPDTITFMQSGFCPGCGHGQAVRLIAEVMEEMELSEKLIAVVDVACGSLTIDMWRFDTIMAAHGRPIVSAIGAKKIRKSNPVMAYIGDGAAYSIGMAETIHAAIRNDNVVVIVVNNSVYGMTGGQCAPTTLPNQKTTSTPYGKNPKKSGQPFRIEHALSGIKIAYLARAALCDVANINKAKKYIKKAFEKHMANEGLCFVELLSACPTNLNMTPCAVADRIKNEVTSYFPVGEFQDSTKEG
ncbi:MAG: thiamine pyrophosphate-dependent enzyme [Johnsonella sp.]|nr:thiamine pyrophosphate-dependent enzyme [Johnsonella sp.]